MHPEAAAAFSRRVRIREPGRQRRRCGCGSPREEERKTTECDDDVPYLVNEGGRERRWRRAAPLEEVHARARAARGGTPHPPPRFWIGSAAPRASRTGPRGGRRFTEQRGRRLVRREGRSTTHRLRLRLGRDIPAGGGCTSDVVVGRCGAGAGHWRHRRPSPSSGRALKRTPLHHPTRPYVDIDGADATLCALPLQLWQVVRWQDL